MRRLPPLDFRRFQRLASTDAEYRMWLLLRNRHLGVKFRRQYTWGPYTLDFFCSQLQLAVEVDGSQHREEEGLRRDAERDGALAAHGIKVLRFDNAATLGATEVVAMDISWEVEQLLKVRPKPLPRRVRKAGRASPSP